MEDLKKVYRFFANQALFPILLSTGLAFLLWGGRVYQSHNLLIYRNLIWNLFLAWIPYLFSILAAGLHRVFPRAWWLLIVPAGFWLLFFPNAPYILTDFLHLEERAFVPLWYDILLVSTFAWTGIFLAVASLRTMQGLVRQYVGSILSWIFVSVVLGLNALGIYLGRFERWNSWDFFFHPRRVIADVVVRLVNPTENLRFVGFTLLFTAFLFVCYMMFISMRKSDEIE